MEFSLDRFYQLNRKAIIWIVLFGLIYLLRDFFTLIFLTFIISFFAYPASRTLQQRLRMPSSLSVVVVYLAIIIGYIALYVLVLPNVVRQATSIRTKLPSIQAKIDDMRITVSERYPSVAWLFNFDVESSLLTEDEIRDWPAFCRNLLSSKPPSPHIRSLLPPELVADLARYREENLKTPETTNTVAGPDASTSPPDLAPGTPAAALEERLVAALNQYVLENPQFFETEGTAPLGDRLNAPEIRRLLHEKETTGLSPRSSQRLNRLILEAAYPSLQKREFQAEKRINRLIETSREKLQEHLPNFALSLLKFFGNSLLAILFSFLIVFDYARLSKEVKGLASSRLRDFFSEAGQPVVKFAISVGDGFRAIVTIAFFTAVLMVIALLALRISSIAFLAVVTFVTGLVPVVGTFFQAVPLILVALNERGPDTALWALVALGIIHVIIGYIVGPIIFGRQFKLNIVAVIFILFIGHQVAGVWGMILGVPIANYLLRDVLGVPIAEEKPRPKQTKPIP